MLNVGFEDLKGRNLYGKLKIFQLNFFISMIYNHEGEEPVSK